MVLSKKIILSVFLIMFTFFAFQEQANAVEIKTDSYLVTGPDEDGCYTVLVVVYIVEDGTKNLVAYEEAEICPGGGTVQREDFVKFYQIERSPKDLEAYMDNNEEVETAVVESVDSLINGGEGSQMKLPTGQNNPNIKETKDIKVFPNPSKGHLEIEHKLQNATNIKLKLHTTDGKMVFGKTLNGKSKVSLPALQDGVYIYQISGKLVDQTGTLIINGN